MKNYLKVLLALLLVVTCMLACVACGDKGTDQPSGEKPGNNDVTPGPDGDQTGPDTDDPNSKPNDDPVKPDDTVKPDEPVVETYKINFVYSYTTKILNDYGRPKTVKEKITVKTLEIPKDNTGFTAELLAEKDSILYHGYGFYEWYAESDWEIDDENNTQFPKDGAVAFDFASGAVSSDMTLYGVKGNLAGRDAYWEIVENTVVNEKGDANLEVVLKITGSGAMFDYEKTNAIDIPWYAYSVSELDEATGKSKEIRNYTNISRIEISPEITYIGNNAFNGLSGVSALDLGENSQLEVIGEMAFKNLSSLRSFVAPSPLKTIGKSSFDTTGLTSLWLNDGLVTIDDNAFSGSKGISWVILPASIEKIGVAAFHPGPGQETTSHSLSKIYYTGQIPEDGAGIFSSIDVGFDNNALTSKATVYYYVDSSAEDVDTRGAYWYYFEGENSDEPQPMAYCLTIKYYLPSSAVSAYWTDYVPATPKWEVNKNGVGSYKLVGTIDKENVDFRDEQITYNGYRFDKYGDEGKYTYNGGKSDFCEGAKLSDNMSCNLSRGSILSEGGGVIFAYSSNVLTLSLDSAAIKEGASTDIWNFAEAGDTGNLWTGATSGLKNIKEIYIGDGITYIGALTFNGIGNVTSIVIPESVKGISVNAFSGCTNLSSIYYTGDLSECKIYDTKGNETGDTLATEGALTGLLSTTCYQFSEKGTPEDGTYWSLYDGKYVAWSLNKAEGTLYIGGDAEMVDFATETSAPWYSAEVIEAVKTVEFAGNILTIGENVLHRYYNVENVVLPKGITKIPASAFAGTKLLQDPSKYPGGALIINNLLIKVDPRRLSSALFEIPFNTTLVAGGAFEGCDAIEEIYIPSTVRNIADNALADLTNLKVIYTDILSTAWKNVASNAGYSSDVYLCGYDDYDFDSDNNTTEKLWQKLNGEYILFACSGVCNHESGVKTCKHVWGEWYTKKNQTHTANGTMARMCTNPGCFVEDLDNETLLKADAKENGKFIHTFGAYTIDDVTHCVTNRTMSAKCIYCTEVDVVEIPGTIIGSHSFVYVADGNATCYHAGTKTGTCSNEFCEEIDVVDDPVGQPALDHSPADQFVLLSDALCNSKFEYVKYCTNDGCEEIVAEYYEENIEPAPHTWAEQVANKYLFQRATLTSSNAYYKSCSECGTSCKGITNETFVNYGSMITVYDWDDENLKGIITSSGKFDIVSNLDKFNYAVSVIEGAERVLEIGKVKGAADSVLKISNPNTATATEIIHTFTTSLRTGSLVVPTDSSVEALDYVYRLGMANDNGSFFNLYFAVVDGMIEIKDGFDEDAVVFATVNASEWFDISITYDTKLNEELVDITPVVDENDPNYDPSYVPEEIYKTEYYYSVVVVINGQETVYRSVADSKAGINNLSFKFVESEINAGLESATFYADDTCLRSIAKSTLKVEENTTPDPVDPPEESVPVVKDPEYTFDTDVSDDVDGLVEKPQGGVDITIKDGKKDSDGNYVYAESEVIGGALTVNTSKNEKVTVDSEGNYSGLSFSTSTVFALVGELGEEVGNVLYVFDSKLILGAGAHQFVFANSNLTQESFAFEISITDKGLVIKDSNKGLNGELGEIVVAGIDNTTAFDLRVELYSFATTSGDKLVAKIYVNDVYVGSSDSAATSGNKVVDYAIESVAIYHKADADASITFDDVYANITGSDVVYIPEVVFP